MKPKIIAVVGPTASGKSTLANEIVKKFNGEILCVDSRTVYRGMDVGTAKDVVGGNRGKGRGKDVNYLDFFARFFKGFFGKKITNYFKITRRDPSLARDDRFKGIRLPSLSPLPSPLDIPHHGIDLVEPNEEMNGALFKEYADKVIADMVSRGKLPVLVGGTGLWFDMIIDNLAMPEVEPDLKLRAELEQRSEEDLFAEFVALDPIGAEVIDRKNKRRLIRALEVCKKTGQPFSELRKKGEPKYDTLWLGVDWPIPILNERIDRRVDEMVAVGANGHSPLIDEVKNLIEKFGCNVYALSGIGYQEICRYLNNQISLPEAIDEIKLNTKHYAKRQRTWFKRNKKIQWLSDVSAAEKLVSEWLGNK